MYTILEYIVANYTWFLCGTIIILLAIIGYYADNTNFGQGKQDDSSNENENLPVIKEEKTEPKIPNKKNKLKTEPKAKNKKNKLNVESKLDEDEKIKNFEEQFNEFNEEFKEALPEKEFVDEDLLDEIDNLSLDKTQKINLDDIPDLDDVELPEIKNLNSNKNDDIWKF